MRPKSETSNFELLVPSKVQLQKSGTAFQPRIISSYATLRRLSHIGKQYANMLEEYDTGSQVFDQTFEVSTTNVYCLIERVADRLIKQLPREKAQVSSDYSTAVEF